MGLIKAAFSAIGTTLADQWKEYIYCDSMDGDTLVKKGEVRVTAGSNTNRTDNIITNGSKVAVNEGQFMLIVENGKVVDFTSEPGAYTYDTGTEPSLFDSGFSGLKESFKKVGKRFAYGGSAENDQRVYYVNIKEIMNNKVGVGDVPFRDSEFNFSMKLQGFGVYSYKITDPVMFYTNVCSNVTDSFKKSAIDEQLRTEVQNALQPALGRIALKRIAYDQLPLFTKEIAQEVNNELSEDWTQLRGISVVSVAFASIKPDDASAAKINQMQEARVYTNSQMQTGRATAAGATAMETAAGNPNGAMNAFMGMGMTNAFGANLTQATMQNNQQGAGIPVMPGVEGAVVGAGAVLGGWKCECGTQNTGKFCTECGKPMPAPAAGWTCECGTQNTGKFCTECGKPMPVASEEWTCECGNKNTGKFCTECGKPRS